MLGQDSRGTNKETVAHPMLLKSYDKWAQKGLGNIRKITGCIRRGTMRHKIRAPIQERSWQDLQGLQAHMQLLGMNLTPPASLPLPSIGQPGKGRIRQRGSESQTRVGWLCTLCKILSPFSFSRFSCHSIFHLQPAGLAEMVVGMGPAQGQ